MDSRKLLVRYFRWLRRYGYNDAHSGNLSVRDEAGVWITPSGCNADLLQQHDLHRCQPGEPPPAGASLDCPLHLAVYEANPEIRCVMHSHGAYSIAVTLAGGPFRPLDFEGQLYFPEVPVLEIEYQHYVEQSPQAVAAMLTHHPIGIVKGHGVYAAAADIDLAYKWTCSLESSAKIAGLIRSQTSEIRYRKDEGR